MSYRYIPIHPGSDANLQINTNLIEIERAFARGEVRVPVVNEPPPQQGGYIYFFEGVPGYEDGLYIWDGSQWFKIGPTDTSIVVKAFSIDGTGDVWTDLNNMNFSSQPGSEADGTVLIDTDVFVTFYHDNQSYVWAGPRPVNVGANGNHTAVEPDLAPMGIANLVTSVHGRTGDVVGMAGDYTYDQVGADPAGSAQAVQDNLDTHEAAANPHQKVNWRGEWAGGEYLVFDMATENGWLGVANQTTTEHLAPQATGPAGWGLPDLMNWAESSHTGVVYSGHTYTFTTGGWISRIRAYAPLVSATTEYRIGILNSTDPGNQVFININNPILTEDGWATVWLGNYLAVSGTVLTVFIDVINTGSDSRFDGDWAYGGQSQGGAPPVNGWNTDNQGGILRVWDIDLNSNDWGGNMINAVPGTTIQITSNTDPTDFVTYRVLTNPIDQGTYVQFTVDQTDTGGSIGLNDVCSIEFIVPVAQATDYSFENDYWNNNPATYATIAGVLQLDGVDQPGFGNTAFGIDIEFTPGTASTHWDILASSQDVSGGGTGGGSGETNAGINVGTGAGEVYRDKTDVNLNFKTLRSGDGSITVTNETDTVDLRGQVWGGTNTGTGVGVYRDVSGTLLRFKRLRNTDGSIVVSESTSDIDIRLASATTSRVVVGSIQQGGQNNLSEPHPTGWTACFTSGWSTLTMQNCQLTSSYQIEISATGNYSGVVMATGSIEIYGDNTPVEYEFALMQAGSSSPRTNASIVVVGINGIRNSTDLSIYPFSIVEPWHNMTSSNEMYLAYRRISSTEADTLRVHNPTIIMNLREV